MLEKMKSYTNLKYRCWLQIQSGDDTREREELVRVTGLGLLGVNWVRMGWAETELGDLLFCQHRGMVPIQLRGYWIMRLSEPEEWTEDCGSKHSWKLCKYFYLSEKYWCIAQGLSMNFCWFKVLLRVQCKRGTNHFSFRTWNVNEMQMKYLFGIVHLCKRVHKLVHYCYRMRMVSSGSSW